MSLESFEKKIGAISGVRRTAYLEDENGEPVLQVVWFGEPADYSNRVRKLRSEHPNITQVEAPEGEPTKTPDAMPIEYYSEE